MVAKKHSSTEVYLGAIGMLSATAMLLGAVVAEFDRKIGRARMSPKLRFALEEFERSLEKQQR